LNKVGQILLGTSNPYTQYDALVYNVNTHTLTDLASVIQAPGVLTSYSNFNPFAIDDDGRILLRAANDDKTNTFDTLLLTPAGVSSQPIPLTTPEPGTLAMWGIIAVVVATRTATR